jgi:hypothetical protein
MRSAKSTLRRCTNPSSPVFEEPLLMDSEEVVAVEEARTTARVAMTSVAYSTQEATAMVIGRGMGA